MDANLVVFLLIFLIGSIMYIIFPDEVKNFSKKHPHFFRGGSMKNYSDGLVRTLGILAVIFIVLFGVYASNA